MTLLHIIDTLCDVTTKQADLLRELVTDLEHMNQVSEEVKNYYREKLDSIDQEMNVAEYGCRELPYMDEAPREIIREKQVHRMFPMCLFKWRKIMQREKWKTMDVILVILAIFLLVFVIVMIAIYIRTGGIPDTLCTCVFSVCGGECGVMGWIKTTKDRHLSRQYELEDRETDKKERMEERENE
mgnify:CR=1 FL=1